MKLNADDVQNARGRGAALIDIRKATSFGAVFVPGSINIGLTDQSASWLRMVVETDRELALIGDHEGECMAAAQQFEQAGYGRILGFLDGGVQQWANLGLPMDHLPQLTVQALRDVLEKYTDHVVLDVRTAQEWEAGHVDDAVHKPLAELVRQGIDVSVDRHITAICGSGYRSNIAGSYLKAHGYAHVYSVPGGMKAWRALTTRQE